MIDTIKTTTALEALLRTLETSMHVAYTGGSWHVALFPKDSEHLVLTAKGGTLVEAWADGLEKLMEAVGE